MKSFLSIVAVALAAVLCVGQAAEAQQVFVNAGGVRVSVGNNRAFVNRGFRNLATRQAINQHHGNHFNNIALLKIQAQNLRNHHQNRFQVRSHRNNLQAVAFVNTHNDLNALATLRQVQQYNDFSRVAALNQAAYFDQREAFLLNNFGHLQHRNNVQFIRGNHCR